MDRDKLIELLQGLPPGSKVMISCTPRCPGCAHWPAEYGNDYDLFQPVGHDFYVLA